MFPIETYEQQQLKWTPSYPLHLGGAWKQVPKTILCFQRLLFSWRFLTSTHASSARTTPFLALWAVFGFVCLNDQDGLLSHHTLTSILSTYVSSGGSVWLPVLVFPSLLLLKDQCLLCSWLQCCVAPRPHSSWHGRSLCPLTVQCAISAILPDCSCECLVIPLPGNLQHWMSAGVFSPQLSYSPRLPLPAMTSTFHIMAESITLLHVSKAETPVVRSITMWRPTEEEKCQINSVVMCNPVNRIDGFHSKSVSLVVDARARILSVISLACIKCQFQSMSSC